MRNLILISLSVFLVVVGSAYCIVWFAQASQIKKGVEQTIAQINASQPYLTYESIETSGFPKDVTVAIVKPHFKGRIDTLLKTMFTAQAATQFAAMPEWDEDVLLNGRLTLGVNVLSDHYSYSVSGDLVDNAKLGTLSHAFTVQTTGDSVCMLQLGRSGGLFGSLWSYGTLARDPQTLLRDLRELDCFNQGNRITDTATHAMLASSGPFRLYVTSAPQGSNRAVRFYVKNTDVQIMQQGDALLAAYVHMLSPDRPIPPELSAYGKQSMEIDFSYNGPADMSTPQQNPPLDIHLSKCTLNSQIASFDMLFDLTNGTAGNKRNARFNFSMTEDFGEAYDSMAQMELRNFIQTAYTSPDPKLASLLAALHKYSADQDYAILYPVLPHFHALGHVVQAVDVGFSGTPDMKSGDFILSGLEFSATPYGITGKGAAKLAPPSPIPAGNMTLVCRNCLPLVDDAMNYVGRVKTATSYFNPEAAVMIHAEPQLTQAVKNFLSALSGQAGADFTYVIASDGGAGVTINGKRTNEIMGLYRDIIVPALHTPGAP